VSSPAARVDAPSYTAGFVTVVMPAYNVGRFVAEAARSVLAQTHREFELIVVDDGSTDDTVEQLARIHDARLRVIRQPNGGSSAARNTGIAAGHGEWIAFIDGDDVWLPEKLERHVAYLRAHPEADLTFAWSRVVDEHGRDTGRTSVHESGVVSFERLFAQNIIGNGSAVVLRRSALDAGGWFDEAQRAAVEHDVWLRVALLRIGNVHGIPETLSLYRMRDGQITKDWRRMEAAWWRLAEKMRMLAPERVAPMMDEARGRMYRYLAYIAYETGDFRQAGAHLRTALSASPRAVLRDRGTWLVGAGVVAHAVLRTRLHARLDAVARRLRSGAGVLAIAFLAISLAAAGCRDAFAYAAFPAAAESKLAGFTTRSSSGAAPSASNAPSAAAYDSLFAYFVEGWETYARPDGAVADVPGLPSRHGAEADGLEAFARTAPLIGAWLHSGRASTIALSTGRSADLADILVRGIIAGTDRSAASYWGDIRDLDQRIVEASDIALTLWLTRDVVWSRLTPAARRNALAWLDQVNDKRVPDNNWHLFVTFVNSVDATLGGPDRRASSLSNYARFKSFYRGDGWFSDGPANAFDYYNAWGIHYQLFWLNEVDPSWDPAFIRDTEREFLSNYRFLMGPNGLPMMGRSVCYRMAAPAPLVYGAARHPDWISPPDARRAVDAVWTYYIAHGAVRNGIVTQGYCGADPRIVDNYSGPSSCLWALRSLIPAFYMPPTDAFWAAPPGRLVVDTASYSVRIPSIGWTVTGDRASGRVRIIQSDSLPASETRLQDYGVMRKLATRFLWRPFRPDNNAAKYHRGEYDSDRPFCGCLKP